MQGVSNGLVTVWAMVAAPAICASANLKDLVRQRLCLVLCMLLATTAAMMQCGHVAQKCVSHSDLKAGVSPCQLLVLHCCAHYP